MLIGVFRKFAGDIANLQEYVGVVRAVRVVWIFPGGYRVFAVVFLRHGLARTDTAWVNADGTPLPYPQCIIKVNSYGYL